MMNATLFLSQIEQHVVDDKTAEYAVPLVSVAHMVSDDWSDWEFDIAYLVLSYYHRLPPSEHSFITAVTHLKGIEADLLKKKVELLSTSTASWLFCLRMEDFLNWFVEQQIGVSWSSLLGQLVDRSYVEWEII